MELLSIFLLSLLGILQMNDTTEIVFVGDAMQHGPQLKAAARADGSYDYSTCFTLMENDFKGADFAVANLECPLAGPPYNGYPSFSCPEDFPLQLQKSGFDLLITANNHILDKGGKGAISTVNALDKLAISHVGTYVDKAERERKLPLIKDINGIQVAFLAYTYGTNIGDYSTSVEVDRINREMMAADVRKAREKGADIVCVCMHWGNEYEKLPSSLQRSTAEYLKSVGVDMIIGSHPHVVQPMEMDYTAHGGTGMVLAYSLGNFISNQNDLDSRGGAMAVVKMARYEDVPIVLGVERTLFFCQKPLNGKGNYQLIPQNFGDSVRVDSKKTFEQFMNNAEELLKKHNKNVK